MKVEFIPVRGNGQQIREIWENLEESCGNLSYFLSWGWIENWIASLPDHVKLELALFRGEESQPLLAFFIGHAICDRKTGNFYGQRHFFKSRGWFVNATGIPDLDRLCMEYNRFLCKQDEFFRLQDILMCLPNSWDELFFGGFDLRFFPTTDVLGNIPPYKTMIRNDTVLLSPFVDLDMVRTRGGDYLSLLSANTRSQVSRSRKLYEQQIGPVGLEVAQDVRQAMDIYHELVALHEITWKGKDRRGAFSSKYLFRFHSQLIKNRFEFGEIQLARVKCGEKTTIGCLYNFVYKNHVYFYQNGIDYLPDKRMKPGLLLHAEAIKYNAAAGHKTYDFLCGDTRYKMSLSTHHNQLVWARLQKPLLKFKIENAARTVKLFLTRHLINDMHKHPSG